MSGGAPTLLDLLKKAKGETPSEPKSEVFDQPQEPRLTLADYVQRSLIFRFSGENVRSSNITPQLITELTGAKKNWIDHYYVLPTHPDAHDVIFVMVQFINENVSAYTLAKFNFNKRTDFQVQVESASKFLMHNAKSRLRLRTAVTAERLEKVTIQEAIHIVNQDIRKHDAARGVVNGQGLRQQTPQLFRPVAPVLSQGSRMPNSAEFSPGSLPLRMPLSMRPPPLLQPPPPPQQQQQQQQMRPNRPILTTTMPTSSSSAGIGSPGSSGMFPPPRLLPRPQLQYPNMGGPNNNPFMARASSSEFPSLNQQMPNFHQYPNNAFENNTGFQQGFPPQQRNGPLPPRMFNYGNPPRLPNFAGMRPPQSYYDAYLPPRS